MHQNIFCLSNVLVKDPAGKNRYSIPSPSKMKSFVALAAALAAFAPFSGAGDADVAEPVFPVVEQEGTGSFRAKKLRVVFPPRSCASVWSLLGAKNGRRCQMKNSMRCMLLTSGKRTKLCLTTGLKRSAGARVEQIKNSEHVW